MRERERETSPNAALPAAGSQSPGVCAETAKGALDPEVQRGGAPERRAAGLSSVSNRKGSRAARRGGCPRASGVRGRAGGGLRMESSVGGVLKPQCTERKPNSLYRLPGSFEEGIPFAKN